MIRVLHVYRTYFPDTQGGLEEVIRQICRNTKKDGVESRVFTLSRNPEPAVLQNDEAEVYRFRLSMEIASCGISFSALSGFKQLVKWADIIHYHFPWPFADILHDLAFVNKPSVVTYHSDIVRQKGLLNLYRPVMHKFLNNMDIIVSTSPNYFATSDVLGRHSDKIEIIPIGLDSNSYPKTDNNLVNEFKRTVGVGYFLFVGVLRYYKGLHILLDAIKDTQLKVVIVGAGPVEEELKRHSRELKLSNIKFMGYVSDSEKVALIQLSRAIVFPSYLRSEAFGVTLLEGAMFKKPLISTEIGTGTSYVNIHEETGLVVPPADPRRLREAMEKLDRDPDLAEKMGIAANKRYMQLFTGKRMGKRYADMYKKMISTKGND